MMLTYDENDWADGSMLCHKDYIPGTLHLAKSLNPLSHAFTAVLRHPREPHRSRMGRDGFLFIEDVRLALEAYGNERGDPAYSRNVGDWGAIVSHDKKCRFQFLAGPSHEVIAMRACFSHSLDSVEDRFVACELPHDLVPPVL